ncbi:MAG: hypothetical protein LBU11_04175 [Zoogloeaceae bacterium]|jgi:hypothetical protein|nr:hypothetical protein [Zoogloeaceae bacterium]
MRLSLRFAGFFAGFVLLLFIFALLYPQYSDYTAKIQVTRIMGEFHYSSLRKAIKEELLQEKIISVNAKKEGVTFFEERKSIYDRFVRS